MWRSRGVRSPDRLRTHCRGLAGSGLPPTPPEKIEREQSGARSWRRCRRPASTRSWSRPWDMTPHPANCGAFPVAPDWLITIATNNRRKNQNLVVRVRHDRLAALILTPTFSRRRPFDAIGLLADFETGPSPGRDSAVIPSPPGHGDADSCSIEPRGAITPWRPSNAVCF